MRHIVTVYLDCASRKFLTSLLIYCCGEYEVIY